MTRRRLLTQMYVGVEDAEQHNKPGAYLNRCLCTTSLDPSGDECSKLVCRVVVHEVALKPVALLKLLLKVGMSDVAWTMT